jgi:hypothetical protein
MATVDPITGAGSACDHADTCTLDPECPFAGRCRRVVDRERWEARITRAGRWTWHIAPGCGKTGLSLGYTVYGSQARAERVARRIIARLNRHDQRSANPIVIR